MVNIKNLSILSRDEYFLSRLLTFKSYDKVQNALKSKGIDFSIDTIKKIKDIVYDLQENEDILTKEDLEIIEHAGDNLGGKGDFNQDLYNFFYGSKEKYPENFFLNKQPLYSAETVSTGIFAVACLIFKVKKKYLKSRDLWQLG